MAAGFEVHELSELFAMQSVHSELSPWERGDSLQPPQEVVDALKFYIVAPLTLQGQLASHISSLA